MHRILARMGAGLCLSMAWVDAYALDSYRFLHVTIETPWTIFVGLLLMIFIPFILMAVMAWRYTERKAEHEKKQAAQAEGKE